LLVVAIVLEVADAFFWPASVSIVPSLVLPAQPARANAVTAVGEQIGGSSARSSAVCCSP
jgi:predicted MFS family arabinose efflux permease